MHHINNKLHIITAIFTVFFLSVSAQRMAVLSDIHVTPGNANEAALRAAVAEINGGNFDVVVVDGDVANEGSDVELANVKAILDGIRHPLFVLTGNHENTWSQSATKTFVDLWGNDRFVTTVDSLVLVGINCGPYMKMGDGHIKQEDLHWLRTTLDAETAGGGRRVLSFNHYPLLDDLDNMQEYLAILEEYPVIGHINGHYHRWRQYPAGGDNSGSDLPCVMVRALDMKNGDYGYSIIDVDNDWVHVYNKQLGKTPEAKFAFAARTQHSKAKFPPRPEAVAPEGFEVTRLWADSASVFTRTGIDDKNVYFGTSTGNVRAVDKHSGKQVWKINMGQGSLFSRPVPLGNNKLAVAGHNGISIVDTRNGVVKKEYATAGGPYVADGMLTADKKAYLQGAYCRLEKRKTSDGGLVWSYDSIGNYCQASPAIDGSDIIFGAWDTNLRCVDLNSGRLKWVWNNGKKANMLGPGNVVPVITPERVYIVAPDRYMTAIDRRTGATLWRDNSHRYRESLGHSADGTRVYAKTMDGELVAVDTTVPEFKELWLTDMGLGYEHAPCVIVEQDGYIYCGSRRGIISIVNAADHTLTASLPLGVSEVNGIDVDPATGDIYVSMIEGTVWRIARK